MREQRDVGVRDVVVGDPARLAVPHTRLGKQVVEVGVHMGAVHRHRGAIPPSLGDVQLGVRVDQIGDRLVQ